MLKTSDICRGSPFERVAINEKCGRAIVFSLVSLFIQNVLIDSLLFPCTTLWRLMLGFGPPGFLSPKEQMPRLLTWLQLAITWGPMAPVLQPLLLMALATNFLTYQIGSRWFQSLPTDDFDASCRVGSGGRVLRGFTFLGLLNCLCVVINMRSWKLSLALLMCVARTVSTWLGQGSPRISMHAGKQQQPSRSQQPRTDSESIELTSLQSSSCLITL